MGDTEENKVISRQEMGCGDSNITQSVSTMHSETKLVITSERPGLCKDFPCDSKSLNVVCLEEF